VKREMADALGYSREQSQRLAIARADKEAIHRICTDGVDASGNLTKRAIEASAAIRQFGVVMDEHWREYRAKWARKRRPLYVRKGGVRR
jgi:hypothetical protein